MKSPDCTCKTWGSDPEGTHQMVRILLEDSIEVMFPRLRWQAQDGVPASRMRHVSLRCKTCQGTRRVEMRFETNFSGEGVPASEAKPVKCVESDVVNDRLHRLAGALFEVLGNLLKSPDDQRCRADAEGYLNICRRAIKEPR
jgi:hypothetical protein